MTDFTEFVANYRENQKIFQEEGKRALLAEAKEILDAHPELEGIGWQQWVPSFNDGDPCRFTRGEVTGKLTSDDDWEMESGTGVSEIDRKLGAFANALNRIDDVLEAVFGSNAEIRITRDGVTVEEYDCGY